jgi:hypothetical protein
MHTEVLDVRDLSTLKDGTFTHVITNLRLPLPSGLDSGPRIVGEMFRLLKIGDVALASTWTGREMIPEMGIVMLISLRPSLAYCILQRSASNSPRRNSRLIHGTIARAFTRLVAHPTIRKRGL